VLLIGLRSGALEKYAPGLPVQMKGKAHDVEQFKKYLKSFFI
jgi:hypothetical protein